MYCCKPQSPGAPLTYFNDGGAGGWSDFLGSEILAKGEIFWVYERRRDLFGSQPNMEGFFWFAKKELRDFFG